MTKRQQRKATCRRNAKLLGAKHPSAMFIPIIGATNSLGNRLERRRMAAGKNPHTEKGTADWRKRAWLRGMGHPKARTCGHVDMTATRVQGKNKHVPKATYPLALDLEEQRNRIRKSPRHTGYESGKQPHHS